MTLRILFFLSLSGVAVIPVIALGYWVVSDALTREINSVVDKHLVIARNVGEALERYSIDLRSGFELVTSLTEEDRQKPEAIEFLKSFNYHHVCFANAETGVITGAIETDRLPCPDRVPNDRFDLFKSLAVAGRVVFSPVMQGHDGDPVFYLLRLRGDTLAIGMVRTTYIVEQGETVSFGEKGHAAIVDQTGQVIAHPRPDWQAEIRDISKIEPVRRMLAGETGTTQFYSPALEADMVTGYTSVPTPGWGVMVPQPLSEIREQVEGIQQAVILVAAACVVGAGLIGWFLSGCFSRNLKAVVSALKQMAAGDFGARASLSTGWKPAEIREVIESFDSMTQDLSASNTRIVNALNEADAANQAKSEFLAVTSHELRTPLNAIIGFSQTMIDRIYGDLNDKYWGYANDIHTAGKHLNALINDVLLISKSGSIKKLEEEEVPAASLLQTMARIHADLAEKKSIELMAKLPEPDFFVLVDERLMRQALINLVTNAIKFTQDGGSITLSATRDDEGARFVVEDTGIGIAEDQLQKIWTPFHQIGNPLIRYHEGSGLGLAIVETIVRAHGGAVSVESTPQVGSRFAIDLPQSRVRPVE
ncbi:MAG: sensor histidine kinase [Alphaproteobacteria bacterium]